jgi:hypothetical protein
MKSFLFPLLLLLPLLPAVGAEPLPLITTLGEHALTPGITLRVEERGKDPLSFTIARRRADGTSSESGYSPLADLGKPFVLCWQPDKKRLWVASATVIGHVEISDQIGKPGEPNQSNAKAVMNFTMKISRERAAEMPPEFRTAADKWLTITDAKK